MNKLILLKTLLTKNISVYVHYGITHRCNLRCRMCGVWKTGNKEAEINAGQIEIMADNLQKLGTQVISIGGGEPLIREDLPEIVRLFLNRRISVRVLSNGVVNDYNRLQKVIDAGVINFSVSLDTLDPEVQNGIIGRNDAFDRVMETFSFLSPILKSRRGLGLINTVVSSANLDELENILNFASKIGFYVSFVPLEIHQFSGKVLGCTETMQDLTFTDNDRLKAGKIFEKLISLKKGGMPVFNSSAFLRNAGNYMSGKDFSWDCRAGILYFSVSPEGLFSICHRYSGYTEEGNELSVISPDFVRTIQSDKYKQNAIKINQSCNACLRPCWAEISNLFLDLPSLLEMIKIQIRTII